MMRPVAVARVLMKHGVSLRKAHQVVDGLASDVVFPVETVTTDLDGVVESLRDLGIVATVVRRPDVDAKRVRQAFGLSQKDFAARFGLEVRTIQNWEQDRNGLDASSRILLALIEARPDVVDAVLGSTTVDSMALR